MNNLLGIIRSIHILADCGIGFACCVYFGLLHPNRNEVRLTAYRMFE